MKKTAFFLLMNLLALNLWGQKFEGGIFSGVCASQVSGDSYSGFNKAGLIIGGSVRRSVSVNWNLQMEMLYVQKGSRHMQSDPSFIEFYQLKVNYIEIPLLLQYRKNEKLVIEGGVSFGVLTNEGTEENLSGPISGQLPFHSKEYALHIGAEYRIAEKFGLNLRLSNSILPIREHASGATYLYNNGQLNTAIYLSLRYYIASKV